MPESYESKALRLYPVLLSALTDCVDCLKEAHEENMTGEGSMEAHQKDEPTCSYCSAILAAHEAIGKVLEAGR